MKDNVGQRAPAHRSPRQDPCFDPLIRSPVSRDSRAAASGSFLDWIVNASDRAARWYGVHCSPTPAPARERVRPRRSLVRRPLQPDAGTGRPG